MLLFTADELRVAVDRLTVVVFLLADGLLVLGEDRFTDFLGAVLRTVLEVVFLGVLRTVPELDVLGVLLRTELEPDFLGAL